MKLLSVTVISVFVLLLFTGCNKNNGISPTPVIKDSVPFENESIKLEPAGKTRFIASDFHFFNASTGLAVTTDGKIYRTIDGGAKWKLQKSDSIPFNKIFFKGFDTGYVVGGSSSCSGNGCIIPGGCILKTTDGGLTWQKIFSVPDVEFVSVTSNAANDLFAVCNGPSQIFKSTNAGESWSQVANSPVNLHEIIFNKNIGFCTAQGDRLLKSTDNSGNWQLNNILENVLYTTEIKFNNDNGYCIADYQKIYRTTDNGSNWMLLLNEEIGRPWALHLANENKCIAFGAGSYSGGDPGTADGAMWLTTDAGATWKRTEFINSRPIHNLSFFNATEGYLLAGNELIKTTIK